MKFIFRNKNFILIVTAYTISQGLQEGFLPVLNINLTPLGIPEVNIMNDSLQSVNLPFKINHLGIDHEKAVY